MKYIVYITTNTHNNKIYIGVHQTETPDVFDGYLGCGAWIDRPSSYSKGEVPLHAAILKYGTKSFIRHTLKVFDTVEEALRLEASLVTKEFISKSSNYNATIGGGMPPLKVHPVYQFTILGTLYKRWESCTDVLNYYDCSVSLHDIIKNKRSFAGYFWSFEPEINIEECLFEANRGFINQYNKLGEFLNLFKNTTIAAQKLDIPRERITLAVFKKKLCCGYYFLKADVDIAEVLSKVYKKTLGKQPIYRYKKSGEFDSQYFTTSDAINHTAGAHGSALKNAVINGYLCGGYLWSYQKADNYFDIQNPRLPAHKVKVALYDLDGNLVKIWDSIKACKKEFPLCLRVCRGELKTSKNYVFKYVD